MRIALITVLLLTACRYQNSGWDETVLPCTESEPGCVCVANVCKECTAEDKTNCTPTEPVCGTDNTCRACRTNDDCEDSGACLDTGACARKEQVIYAAADGVDTSGCGKTKDGSDPCSLTRALAEVTVGRNIIRLGRGTYAVPGTVDGWDFSGTSATVVARDATLIRPGSGGALVSVRNSQSLNIIGGTLQGPNNTTDGIRCSTNGKLFIHEMLIENMLESGVETDGCDLTIKRSTIRGNLRGGITMGGLARSATITNNFVYRNGKGATPPAGGGMVLNLAQGSRLEFNTVVDNVSDLASTSAGGIVCKLMAGQSYDAPFNLVYRNTGGIDNTYQVNGDCTFVGSYYRAAALPNEDSLFFQNANDPMNPSFRLTARSPGEVVDVADCMDIDFERDTRPQGVKCDYGADELRMEQEQ